MPINGTTNNISSSSFPIIRSRCDVKSLTYCDLHYIDLITLSEILNQHPRFKAELKSYLYEDLSFNIQEGVVSVNYLIIFCYLQTIFSHVLTLYE